MFIEMFLCTTWFCCVAALVSIHFSVLTSWEGRNRRARGKMTRYRKGCWEVQNFATGVYRYKKHV